MKSIKNILSIAFLALLLQSCFLFDRELETDKRVNYELDKKYKEIVGTWSIVGYTIDGKDAFDTLIKYRLNFPIKFEYSGYPLNDYGNPEIQVCKRINTTNDTTFNYYFSSFGYWGFDGKNDFYLFFFAPDSLLKDTTQFGFSIYKKSIFSTVHRNSYNIILKAKDSLKIESIPNNKIPNKHVLLFKN